MSSAKRVLLVLHTAATTAFLALLCGPGPGSASPAPLPLPLMTANFLDNNPAGRYIYHTSRKTSSGMEFSTMPTQPDHNLVGEAHKVNSASRSSISKRQLDIRVLSISVLIANDCKAAKESIIRLSTYPVPLWKRLSLMSPIRGTHLGFSRGFEQ